MNEIVIIPTLGDREELEAFTRNRFLKQGVTMLRDTSPAYNDKCDIVPRVRNMVRWAQELHEADWIWIIENDDYYPVDYLDRQRAFRDENNLDWMGSNRAIYYHLGQKRYQEFKWNWNSGLWCMGFKPEVLKGFLWPPDTEPFLDNWICKWVQHRDFARGMHNEHGAIGIKGHGVGKSGSQGSHTRHMQYKHIDRNLEWLRSNTDEEYFEFICRCLINKNRQDI